MRSPLLRTLTCLCSISATSLFGASFAQTNLVSDIPGMAAFTDPNLKNPWGMSFSATSPFWVSNQVTGTSTLYSGTGVPNPLVVTVPPGSPTGQVFNSAGAGNFANPSNGNAATFIFATLAGTIDVWNGGTAAVAATTVPGAVFTGLALANNGAGNFLYAADFAGGKIQVFNSSFAATSLSGNFVDPNLPAGFSPYNVQNVGGKLYVQYAAVDPITHQASAVAGQGIVDAYDLNGNLISRLVSAGGTLNAPWGVAIAPAGFGNFGGDLLIGNFGDGKINAFNALTGAFQGTLTDISGNPIVNSGLWGIAFGNSAANPNALYFAAGINGQADGLFGNIQAVPEPGALGLLAIGFFGLAASLRRRRA
jgi:uncharacterized protein (TIGR03118 family)